MMKAGIKTSELWVAVCGVVVTLLIGIGVINKEGADAVKTSLQTVIAGIIALVPAIVATWYLICRTAVKKREIDMDGFAGIPLLSDETLAEKLERLRVVEDDTIDDMFAKSKPRLTGAKAEGE